MKTVRLIDHNIDRASALTFCKGRFKNSIDIFIDGTIGKMTVNAAQLLAAIQATLKNEAAPDASAGHSVEGKIEANAIPEPKREASRVSCDSRVSQRQLATAKAVKLATRPAPKTAAGRKSVLRLLPSTAKVTGRFRRQPPKKTRATSIDEVIRILSAAAAAAKLKMSIEQVNVRRKKLGLRPD